MTNVITRWTDAFIAEQARLATLTDEEKRANARTHRIGIVDDCYRCVYCEIGSWNTWKQPCF
jgi:hypothetical protein